MVARFATKAPLAVVLLLSLAALWALATAACATPEPVTDSEETQIKSVVRLTAHSASSTPAETTAPAVPS